MKKTFLIGEIADFFHIPSSTLRFWESKGLISPSKQKNNQYREYTLADLMKISDIVFYKNLGIPLKNINDMRKKDVDAQENICRKHLRSLHDEQLLLQKRIERLTQHQAALASIRYLKSHPFAPAEIDTECIVSFELTEIEKLKQYIDNPYLYSRVQHTTSLPSEQRGLTLSGQRPASPGEILWQKSTGRYVACLMKEEVTSGYPNNLHELLCEVQKKYKTGYIISRFLTTAMENGRLYDFYKTFIEINRDE